MFENYSRTKRMTQAKAAPQVQAAPVVQEEKKAIRINGYQQILEMLRVAEPTFRDSLLQRIAQHDRRLALSLRDELFG
jgi:hypothetical protein